MPFKPDEIESKEFLVTMRGYDKDEVKAFLQAIALDYKDLIKSGPTAGGRDPLESLGEEIGSVLQSARASALSLRQRAEAESSSMVTRAKEETASLRDAAAATAKRLSQEAEQHALEVRTAAEDYAGEVRSSAEQYAREVRSSAEREAQDRVKESAHRVERLQATEGKVRQRLYHLETMLQALRQELESADVPETGTPTTVKQEGPSAARTAAKRSSEASEQARRPQPHTGDQTITIDAASPTVPPPASDAKRAKTLR